ncbi:MAG: MBL fold metallo-hydrolase [Bacteroidales bacterium]|jgi:phosphoribosyl 1,2-cyclic phosphate phosphodiesterase|nr:MBL fold metallo-hydrolase [Bacteroidales bacterium]NLM91865.1 MBL fold metallo-hydrolase [Bacteroidales bacterium]
MEITVLGTGTSQGVPVVACKCPVCLSKDSRDKRLRTSVLVKQGDDCVAIDAGPDFRQQMLREGVGKLDAVVITHSHKDHIGGLDDVRAFNWVQKKAMDVYATPQVLRIVKQDFSYAFEEEKYPGVPKINLHAIDNLPFLVNNLEFIPIKALHLKMPVLGFRIGDFSYLTDANQIEAEELDKMRGSKVVIINALRKKKHISHFSLEEAVAILQELAPEKGYLTHISHQMGFSADVEKELPENIHLAYDGLKLKV